MAAETFSFLLRPVCVPRCHHAAVSRFVLCDSLTLALDEEDEDEQDQQPRSRSSSTRYSHSRSNTTDSNDPSSGLSNAPVPRIHSHSRAGSTSSFASFALSRPGVASITTDKAVLTCSRDSTIRSWQRHKQQLTCAHTMEGHTEWVSDLCLLSDKRTLVSGSADTLIKFWDLQTGLCTHTLEQHTDYVEKLAYSAEAGLMASAGLDSQVYLWRLDELQSTPTECLSLSKHSGEECGSLYALDLSRDGRTLLSGGTDRVVRVWDTRSCLPWLKLLGHKDNIRSLSVSEDGNKCVSVSNDNMVKYWDIRKQRCLSTHLIKPAIMQNNGTWTHCSPKMRASTWTMAVNSTFTKVYTAGSTGMVVVTDLSTGRIEQLISFPSPVVNVHLDESANELWCGTFDSSFSCWDVRPSLLRHQSFDADDDEEDDEAQLDEAPQLLTQPICFNPGFPPLKRVKMIHDGWHVLTENSIGDVQLWDVVNARLLKNYGQAKFEQLLDQKNNTTGSKPIPAWFTGDVRLGCLCITLEKRNCFAAHFTIPTPPLPDADAPAPIQQQINLGETTLHTILSEWRALEKLALSVQEQGRSAAPTITHTRTKSKETLENQQSKHEENHSNSILDENLALLSPRRQTSSAAGSATAISALTTVSVIGVSIAIVISFTKQQKRQPLYLSVPIPPLPLSLAPHLPAVTEDQKAEAREEESMMELDRRRSLYYSTIPLWVEERVFSAKTVRAVRPPVIDTPSDLFLHVKEWTSAHTDADDEYDDDEGDDDEYDDAEEESELNLREDSQSLNARTSPTEHQQQNQQQQLHRSPPSQRKSRSLLTSSLQQLAAMAAPRINSTSSTSTPTAPSINNQRVVLSTPHDSPSGSPLSISSFLHTTNRIPRNASQPSFTANHTPSPSAKRETTAQTLPRLDLAESEDMQREQNGKIEKIDNNTAQTDKQYLLAVPSTSSTRTRSASQETPTSGNSNTSTSSHSSHNKSSVDHDPNKVLFQLLPTNECSLPSVIPGALLIPRAMSVGRIKQYLVNKLLPHHISPPLSTNDMDLFCANTVLSDDTDFGSIRDNLWEIKEKMMRVYFTRRGDAAAAHTTVLTNGITDNEQPASSADSGNTQPEGEDSELHLQSNSTADNSVSP